MTREEELEQIKRVLAGDTDAFEPLVTENQSRVYTLSLRMLSHEADAYDAAQETFLRAFNALHSFRGECRFSTWLCRLAGNICIDMLRARRRSRTLSLNELTEEDDVDELEIPDERFDPQNELEKKELRESVREALAQLPEEYRRILTLRELGGLSYEELGQELGLESGTVKSRLNRARRRLCEILLSGGNISRVAPSKKREGGGRRDL